MCALYETPVNNITQTTAENTTSRSRYYQEPQSRDPVLMTLITCTSSTFLHFLDIFKNTSTFKSDDIPECQLRVKGLPSSSRLLMGHGCSVKPLMLTSGSFCIMNWQKPCVYRNARNRSEWQHTQTCTNTYTTQSTCSHEHRFPRARLTHLVFFRICISS